MTSRETTYNGWRYVTWQERKRIEADARQARPLVLLGCGHMSALDHRTHAERAHRTPRPGSAR